MKTVVRVVFYRDKAGAYRWRMRSRNGRTLADSGEGYTRRHDCHKSWIIVLKAILQWRIEG